MIKHNNIQIPFKIHSHFFFSSVHLTLLSLPHPLPLPIVHTLWMAPKSKKVHFWALLPKFGQTRIFPKNWAPSLLSLYAPLTSCKISKKSLMSQFREKLVTERRTDGQHSFHRTFRLRRGSNNTKSYQNKAICYILNTSYRCFTLFALGTHFFLKISNVLLLYHTTYLHRCLVL